MRRFIDFIVVVLVTFYTAVIYNSKSLVFLGYAEVFIVLLLFLYNCMVFYKLRIIIDAPLNITEYHKKIPIHIVIYNYSKLPTGKISIQLSESYVLKPKKKKTVFYSSVAGKRNGQAYAKAEIHASWQPQYVGKAVVRLKKVSCFDLLGVLALPLPKKSYQSSEKVTVLPEIFPVPVDAGVRSREFAMEQERYLLANAEENSAEQFQIREYRQGDRLRSIHWKLSAKEDELIVREYLPKAGCSVLLFLDLSRGDGKKGGIWQGMLGRKKNRKRKEAFLSILLSLSGSIVRNGCRHYVVWYDQRERDVVRFCMEKEEDIYGLLMEIDSLEETGSSVDIEEGYKRKYREQTAYVTKLMLNQKLQLFSDGELLCWYQDRELGQALASHTVLL